MACECGHLNYDHQRVVLSVFPCRHCDCTDYAEEIPDRDTIEDLQALLPFDEGDQS